MLLISVNGSLTLRLIRISRSVLEAMVDISQLQGAAGVDCIERTPGRTLDIQVAN